MLIEDFAKWVAEWSKKTSKALAWPNQARAIEQNTRIKAHTDTEHYPERLFKERAPNQTPEQQKYIRTNFKATTYPVFQDYLTVLGKMWIDSNWQIVWPEGSEDFKDYCNDDLPIYGSIEAFMKHTLTPYKAIDPNGIMAVRPSGFKYVSDVDGRPVFDDTQRITPTLYYHPSENILHLANDLVIAVDLEKSPIKTGEEIKLTGDIIYCYTPTDIYRAIQVKANKHEKDSYRLELWYSHGEGVVPCRQMAGVPLIGANGLTYWVSPFYYSVPLLDIALVDANWLMHMKSNCAFPFRIVRMEPCDYKDDNGYCHAGSFIYNDPAKTATPCPSCKGRGHRVPISPLGEYQWHEKEGREAGTTTISYKPVEYVEPGDTSMRFVSEQIDINTAHARSILHLRTSNSTVKGSEDMTATGMVIDQAAQFAFIYGISNQTFDFFEWALKRLAWQRYESTDQVPTLIWPQNFDFRTESDIWDQINKATEAGAPPYLRQKLFADIFNTQTASNPDLAADFDTIMAADRLFGLTATEIAARVAQRVIEPWQVTLHDAGFQLIEQMRDETPNYMEMTKAERVAKIVELAKTATFVAPVTQTVDTIQRILGQ